MANIKSIESTHSQIIKKDTLEPGKVLDINRIQRFIKFYTLPILSVIFFSFIVFGGIIPRIQEMFSIVNQIDELREKDKNLDNRIIKLTELKNLYSQRQEIINTINKLIPTESSEVVKFRDRVAKTSIQENLLLEANKTGETIVDLTDSTVASVEDFNLVQIPSEFEMTGRFTNLRSFLNKLYEGGDFFIVSKMDLNSIERQENQSSWSGSFNLTKYQFYVEDTFSKQKTFGNISEDTEPNLEVMNFLEDRFINQQDN